MSRIMIGKYDATIYPEGDGYTGAIDLGVNAKGQRRRVKRKGRTKAQVKDKLREAVADLEAGVTTDAGYTVQDAVADFLQKGLKGRTRGTIDNYRSLADHNVTPQIGGIKVKELTADQLDDWLDERAEELSTRSLRLIHQIVERAIRQAQARDKVRRNVASLVDVPEGQEGPAVQVDDAGPGRRAPGDRRGRQSPARGLRGPVAARRCPHRGGPGDHVGRGGSQGRHGGRLPVGAGQGRHQDPQEPARPETAHQGSTGAPRSITPARPPNGSRRGRRGRNTTSCSAARTARRWTAGT